MDGQKSKSPKHPKHTQNPLKRVFRPSFFYPPPPPPPDRRMPDGQGKNIMTLQLRWAGHKNGCKKEEHDILRSLKPKNPCLRYKKLRPALTRFKTSHILVPDKVSSSIDPRYFTLDVAFCSFLQVSFNSLVLSSTIFLSTSSAFLSNFPRR